MTIFTSKLPLLIAAALGIGTLSVAQAESARLSPRQVHAAYAQECAACHIAYPAGALPARSWARLMGGLDKHFGVDASLNAATAAQIGKWLQANAGTDKRVGAEPPQDRITRSAWFQRAHRELNPKVWKLASVKSASNCAACHRDAARGNFDEDNVRVPAGINSLGS